MKRWIRLMTCAWMLGNAGCASPAIDGVRSTRDDVAQIEILAFNALREHDDSSGIGTKYAVILCIDDHRSPPRRVFDAMAGSRPAALPCSTPARVVLGRNELCIDGDPARPALEYTLSDITIKGDDAWLHARYYEGMTSSALYTIWLHRAGGHWSVAHFKVNGVS